MDADRLVDSVKFLLKSVRQLSDRFVETNENLTRSFESVRGDVSEIENRLKILEEELLNLKDQALVDADQRRKAPELPVKEEHQERLIPALNLPHESVLDVYRNTPALLEPFARSVSVSGRTLSGSIDEIELEVFAQGSSWVVELQVGDRLEIWVSISEIRFASNARAKWQIGIAIGVVIARAVHPLCSKRACLAQ